MRELFAKIRNEMEAFRFDAEGALQGNKSAGARSRKQTLNLEKLFKQWRKESVAATKK